MFKDISQYSNIESLFIYDLLERYERGVTLSDSSLCSLGVIHDIL